MKIYNTLTRNKEDFIPREEKKVQMFVCGPTVYDYIHIGNARTFVFFDVVAKYLRHNGFKVEYIQNITDIDNKIIERAQEQKVDPLEYAKKYNEIFKEDMKALGVTSPEYKNATDHIQEVIKQVQTLLDKKNAYAIENDGIYFDLSTFHEYGKLSGRTANMANDAVSRIDENPNKRNKGDFCLWKFSKPGEPSWEADFETNGTSPKARGSTQKAISGLGRPGWHIEDTAITEKLFGPQYDLHGGGQDLIFPHHEAEIAQQESASGLKPFVKYWMHSEFLVNKDKKMSKSLGNFMTLHEALKNYSSETLRFYFLSAHYRSPLDFSDEILKQAEAAVSRLAEFVYKLRNTQIQGSTLDLKKGRTLYLSTTEEIITKAKEDAKAGFENEMSDDFNTPRAFGHIFELVRTINPLLGTNRISSGTSKAVVDMLMDLNKVLGIIPSKPTELSKEITELICERESSRESKDFTRADQLRSQIESLGYQIDDTIYGPLVKKQNKTG